MTNNSGWIGFDLDGTLAGYNSWSGVDDIGEPILPMVKILQAHLAEGVECRIMTARVSGENAIERAAAERAIQLWCLKHIGCALPVTCKKDFAMWALYDDRAIAVEKNTGRILGGEVQL